MARIEKPNLHEPVLDEAGVFVPVWGNFLLKLQAEVSSLRSELDAMKKKEGENG